MGYSAVLVLLILIQMWRLVTLDSSTRSTRFPLRPSRKTKSTNATTTTTNATTTTAEPTEETIPLDEDRMDINAADVETLVNMEAGTYTPIEFDYINMQNAAVNLTGDDHETDGCFKQYFRCVSSQVHPSFICATNELYLNGANWNSYCDVYLDNCRKRFRYWYIVDVGYCIGTNWNNYYFHKVLPTQKKLHNEEYWVWDRSYPF